jgi:hypothetical protein
VRHLLYAGLTEHHLHGRCAHRPAGVPGQWLECSSKHAYISIYVLIYDHPLSACTWTFRTAFSAPVCYFATSDCVFRMHARLLLIVRDASAAKVPAWRGHKLLETLDALPTASLRDCMRLFGAMH